MQDEILERDDNIDQSVGTPEDDPKDVLRQAREMIPVGRSGTAPLNFSQMVDFARDMSRARAAIPQHLKANVGDCLAIVDIATRVGLSPYMVANKTYVQGGRLCFESQLYHAFAQASNLLKGDLTVEYEGDGDDMRCIVTGFLRNDPKPRVHVSERLRDAHPGHVTKTIDGVEKKFCKGSPLWDKKPKVQLFYDTSRDWVRIYCPRATLGIFTPDEIEEYGPEFARDVTPGGAGLAARLAAAPPSDAGHKDGHAEAEINAIRAENGQPVPDKAAPVAPAGEGAVAEPKPKAKRASGHPKAKAETPQADTAPATVADYLAYARRWIKAEKDLVELGQRWSRERKMRNELGVTEDDRKPVEELIKRKLNK